MIGIRNLGPLEGEDKAGIHRYEVRVNLDAPVAHFVHRRSDGLAECLRRAADAVERAGVLRLVDLCETGGKKKTPKNLKREEK